MPKVIPEDVKQEAIKRRENGEGIVPIAEDLGVSYQSVWRWSKNGSNGSPQNVPTLSVSAPEAYPDQEYHRGRKDLLWDVVKSYEPRADMVDTLVATVIVIPKEG